MTTQAAPTAGRPLVLFFHGDGGNGNNAMTSLYSQTDVDGAVVLQPDGPNNIPSLNRGGTAWSFYMNGSSPDDVLLTKTLIDQAVAGTLIPGVKIDPTKIYAVGASRGGFMVYTLQIDVRTAGYFAAVTSLYGHFFCEDGDTVCPARYQGAGFKSKVPTLHIHGNNDTSVPPPTNLPTPVTADLGTAANNFWFWPSSQLTNGAGCTPVFSYVASLGTSIGGKPSHLYSPKNCALDYRYILIENTGHGFSNWEPYVWAYLKSKTKGGVTPTPSPSPSVTPSPSPSPSPSPTVTPSPVPSPQPSPSASPVMSQLRGVVIGNTEFAYFDIDKAVGPIPNQTYPVMSTKLVDYYLGKRMKVMRLMFSWEGMQQDAFGPIPGPGNYGKYFTNLKTIVDYATSKGMSVVIEPWDSTPKKASGFGDAGGLIYWGTEPTKEVFADFWSKLAAAYKGNPAVIFSLINEPNHMSSVVWWSAAQAAITAIRATGATQQIFAPGISYTQASSWTSANLWDDTAPAGSKISNAVGFLTLKDPLGKLGAEVHTYLDSGQGGGAGDITSVDAARKQLAPVVAQARANGYKIYLGELGIWAGNPIAPAAWADFVAYLNTTPEIVAYTWFAGGANPSWWPDEKAPHFSISPTNVTTFTGDTANMLMIQGAF